MSTEEELHQVFAVLGELSLNGWRIPGEDPVDPRATALWDGASPDDPADIESLAELIASTPELKN